MTLRTLGLCYLVGVAADGALSMLAMANPRFQELSDALSLLMYVFGVAVLVLALQRRLRPRSAFIIPVLFYCVCLLVGVALFIAVSLKVGSKNLPNDLGMRYMISVFPWVEPVLWALLALQVAIGLLFLYKFARSSE